MKKERHNPGRRNRTNTARQVRDHMMVREPPRPSLLPAITNASEAAGGTVGAQLSEGNEDLVLRPGQMQQTHEFTRALADPSFAKSTGIEARQIGPETSLRNAERILTEYTARVLRDVLAQVSKERADNKLSDIAMNAILGAAAPGQDPQAMDFNKCTHQLLVRIASDRVHTANLTLPLRASSVLFNPCHQMEHVWTRLDTFQHRFLRTSMR